MGRYEMSLQNLPLGLQPVTVPLGPKAGKKLKPGKKEKKRGTFSFEYEYLRFDVLSSLLLEKSAHILEVVVTKIPQDAVASALIGIFQLNFERLFAMMRTALTYEIEHTLSSEQLFRTDSMTTKLMKASSRLLGSLWLYDALHPIISSICASNEIVEVDPLKAEPGANIEHSKEVLQQSCKDVLSAILNSFSHVPLPIQDLIRVIAQIVSAKFPESKIQAISGYVFLRFFGPGISSPEAFGMGVEPQVHARRHLILIAKVIQTIANGSSVREDFLKPMEPWMLEQVNVVNAKLLELCDGPNASNPLPLPRQSSQTLLAHYGTLVDWVASNQFILEKHGVSAVEYASLKEALAPYARALAALPKEESSHKSQGAHTNLVKTKSKQK